MRRAVWLWLAVLLLLITACEDSGVGGSDDFSITVVVDEGRQVYRWTKPISVGQFLEEVGVIVGPDDEVNPLLQTQVRDGMRITVTRVVYSEPCETEPLPFETEVRPTQLLSPGEQQVIETGVNGTVQICYRETYKDGVRASRVEINRVVVVEPRNEIIYEGAERLETFIPIEGVLAFISNNQAWIIDGNTSNLLPLTEGQMLDGRVFDLSTDGGQLLYTVATPDESDPVFSNELWAVLDVDATRPQSVQLLPEDVRFAQWVPAQRAYTVSYSTATPTIDNTGWRAFNDLHLMQINPDTGEVLTGGFEEVVSSNMLGTYAYWGRRFAWSTDGTQLAWANADGVGLVNIENPVGGSPEFITLLDFYEYAPLPEQLQGSSVWVPTLSWSPDGNLVTTVHGQPYSEEDPEDSIIFDLAVIDVDDDWHVNPFFSQSGIWSVPTYSPFFEGDDGTPTYQIAFFKAREPLNSPGSQYDVWVMDRDGSNARVLFPGEGRPGVRPDPEDGIVWSPSARQIALIHQGNLWIVDVQTGQSTQITSDGQASRPRWSRE